MRRARLRIGTMARLGALGFLAAAAPLLAGCMGIGDSAPPPVVVTPAPVQPVAALHDLLNPVLHTHQQFAQPQLGQRVAQRIPVALTVVAVRVAPVAAVPVRRHQR